MIYNAKIALCSYFLSWTWSVSMYLEASENTYAKLFMLISIALHFWVYRNFSCDFIQIAWRAYMLGFIFSVGLSIVFYHPRYISAGLYLIVLSMFHFGEYFATALFNPSQLKLEAFILNHSFEYNLALLLSWIEYGIFLYFYPASKKQSLLIAVGFIGCLLGDGFRKLAMYTAGRNFNHVVQYRRQVNHVLVTEGVYSLVRHPSYSGWFCWSVSTQILLANPVCFIGYAIASWKFFSERIAYEEMTLIHFFGRQYIEYQKKVPSGIPFVYSLKIDAK